MEAPRRVYGRRTTGFWFRWAFLSASAQLPRPYQLFKTLIIFQGWGTRRTPWSPDANEGSFLKSRRNPIRMAWEERNPTTGRRSTPGSKLGGGGAVSPVSRPFRFRAPNRRPLTRSSPDSGRGSATGMAAYDQKQRAKVARTKPWQGGDRGVRVQANPKA